MIRALATLLCVLALLAAALGATTPATAQVLSPLTAAPATTPGQATAPTAPTPATPASSITPPPITPEQARQALAVLNDPAKRAEITATLEAIARAQPAASGTTAPTATPGGTTLGTATPGTPALGTATPAASVPAASVPAASIPAASVPAASIPAASIPAASIPAASIPAALGIPLTPDSLGAEVLVDAANFMNHAADQLSGTLRAARGIPLLWEWLVTMATDPLARELLSDLAWRLAIALGVSFAVLWAISRIVRRPLRAVCRRLMRMPPTAPIRRPAQQTDDEADNQAGDQAGGQPGEEPESGEALAELGEIEPPRPRRFNAAHLLRRVPPVLAEVALYLLPVLGFVVAGHVIAGSALGTTSLVRLVLLAVIDSYALCALTLHLAGALLAPHHRRLRLLPVRDATAMYAFRWTRRLLVVGVVGYAAAEVGLLLGLSQAAHLALLKATVLVMHVLIAIIVVQKRRVVRGWIRAPADATGIVAIVRNRVAAIWHWIALFYLAALWLVWAVELPAGYERLSRVVLITLAVAVVARLTRRACMVALDRLVLKGAELATHYPGLDRRLAVYHPILRAFARVAVTLLALLLFLQLLGFDVLQWLIASPLGQHVAGSLTMLAITVLLALAVWEAVNAAFERHLAHLTRQAQIAKIARLRTLLPILRTTLLGAVLTVTVLMVLSEVGINTAPLLASAGIIGVAIGFGSQKLVQDLITGLFLLLENTMQVGDVVSLGGLTGVIETLSVRTIHLRAEDGSMHVIPFSSVGTVTNMTRDYARAVVQVGVAYKENVDRVIEVLCGVVTQMRQDPQFRQVILGDLDVYGLDQLTASAVIIKGRIMCTPFARWSVGREFNRRMKARFEQLGIEMPSTDQRLILDQPLTISIGSSPDPSTSGPSPAAPSPAAPSRAAPSQAAPSQAAPSQAAPSQAAPSSTCAEPPSGQLTKT